MAHQCILPDRERDEQREHGGRKGGKDNDIKMKQRGSERRVSGIRQNRPQPQGQGGEDQGEVNGNTLHARNPPPLYASRQTGATDESAGRIRVWLNQNGQVALSALM